MKQLIISVHGIRTFGNWQERLEHLLQAESSDRDLTVINYKFGYFSILAFLVPFLRWFVVRQFRKFYVDIATSQNWDRIDLAAHSFGTHIIAWALYGIDSAARPQVNTIVLAGSVLKSSFPWQVLVGHGVTRVVNDCGTRDDILVWNQICVLGTGIAGRLGFTGGIGKAFRNRFFKCGHSGYFLTADKPDDKFMREYWVPLLLTDVDPILVDEREGGELSGIVLWLLNNAEPIKIAVYAAPFVALSMAFLYLATTARIAQATAETQRKRAEDGLVSTQKLFSELGDLVAERVRPIARLDEVDSLLGEAQGVIGAAQRDDPRIALPFAGLLLTRAEIKSEAGRVKELREMASHAIDVLQQNDQSSPAVQDLFGRANWLIGVSFTGTAADRDTAKKYYDKALAQLEPLGKRFDQTNGLQNDWKWLRSLANVQAGMGDLLLTEFAETDKARQYFQRSIDTWIRLKRLRPDDPEVAYRLSWAENKMGDVLQAQGEDELALGSFESAERGLQPIAERLSVDQWRLTSLAIAQNNIGLIRHAMGRYEQAITAFDKAARSIDTLTSYDPNQSTWLSIQAWTHDNIGATKVRWARAKGDASLLQGARDELKTGLDTRKRLAMITDQPRWRIEPAISRANLFAYEGTEDELARNCSDAADHFDRAARENPSRIGDERDDELVLRSAEFFEWAAIAYRNAGNNMQAEKEIREALKIVNEELPKLPGSRKAFATITQRLEQELQVSAPYKPGACLPQ
ncbi:tetratricopeptide repeat protein [Bradyrhizobium diazoefficiens]|nr:tetratricopeptide repeat protein [Bradyrhizobium diazoefficiens]MBR0779555.1 tetratricopeptide repeat protein [Bradyrhizobium diazoefficiens]